MRSPFERGALGGGVGHVAANVAGRLLGRLFRKADEAIPASVANQLDEVIDVVDNAPKTGGRLGKPSTRQHVAEVADELERRGFEITGGGGRRAERYIPGPGGARRGSAFPDISATKNGRTIHINTVDTLKDGASMTAREARNAAKIRILKPNDHLLTIPKPK